MSESEIYKLRDFIIGTYRTCLLVQCKKLAFSSRYDVKWNVLNIQVKVVPRKFKLFRPLNRMNGLFFTNQIFSFKRVGDYEHEKTDDRRKNR